LLHAVINKKATGSKELAKRRRRKCKLVSGRIEETGKILQGLIKSIQQKITITDN